MVTTRSKSKKVTTETTTFSTGAKKKGGKGKNAGKTSPLMIALGVLALGLVIAIVVVLVTRDKNKDKDGTDAPAGNKANSQFCFIKQECLAAGTGQPTATPRLPTDQGFIPVSEILTELAKINGVTIPAESTDETPLIEIDGNLTDQDLIDLLVDLNITNPNGDILQLALFNASLLTIPGLNLTGDRSVYSIQAGQSPAGEDYSAYLGEPGTQAPTEGAVFAITKTAFPNGCPANCSL